MERAEVLAIIAGMKEAAWAAGPIDPAMLLAGQTIPLSRLNKRRIVLEGKPLQVQFTLSRLPNRVVEQFCVRHENDERLSGEFLARLLSIIFPDGGTIAEIPSQLRPGIIRQFLRVPS